MDHPTKPDKAKPASPSRPARPRVPASAGRSAPARAPAPAPEPAGSERRSGAHKFDKAFPVFLQGERGLVQGIGRNITTEGMFVETRDPCPIGTQVRVTFTAPPSDTEITAVAEVRFQCFLNYNGPSGSQAGMRGMGVRFLRFEEERVPPARSLAQ